VVAFFAVGFEEEGLAIGARTGSGTGTGWSGRGEKGEGPTAGSWVTLRPSSSTNPGIARGREGREDLLDFERERCCAVESTGMGSRRVGSEAWAIDFGSCNRVCRGEPDFGQSNGTNVETDAIVVCVGTRVDCILEKNIILCWYACISREGWERR